MIFFAFFSSSRSSNTCIHIIIIIYGELALLVHYIFDFRLLFCSDEHLVYKLQSSAIRRKSEKQFYHQDPPCI